MGIQISVMRMSLCSLSLLLCMQLSIVFAFGVPSENGRKLLLDGVKDEDDTQKSFNFSVSSIVLAMAVPGVLVLGCILLCPCFHSRKKEDTSALVLSDISSLDSSSSVGHPSSIPRNSTPPNPSSTPRNSNPANNNRFGSVHLEYSQIAKATHSFSLSCKLGEGGFGNVYKAQLQVGQWIAVKRTKKEQFDSSDFNSEVEILSKIEHRSLVKLLGFVDRGDERLIVTEYVSNGTLREHLDGQRGKILDFNQRLEIAIDVAHGLTYLHSYAEKQIIHRDVKSSNILITENLRAKVADFGFARVGPVESNDTHISTKVKGTVGYLDPQYMKTYQLTAKSDVYSFGICLLEILTARRPVDTKRPFQERILIKWAIKCYNEGDVLRVVDPLMIEQVDVKILEKMFYLAFQCAAPGRAERPDMGSVAEQLWKIRMDNTAKRV